jgi:predicted transposase/invertase (TIGR01784 family)
MDSTPTMAQVNPRVDLAFKKIFGVEENKDLLISLVNSIVSKDDQVADLTLLNPYNPKNFKGDKLSVLDIKATGHDGKRFNIEIQITDEADYDKRALYYWAKLYTEQLKEGQDYTNLSKAIGIHILNFTSIPESSKYHNVFHITEKEDGLIYFNDLELHIIELKKFVGDTNIPTPEHLMQQEFTNLLSKVKTSLDMWVTFLMRHDLMDKDHLPHELEDPNLKKALGVLEVMNFTDEERQSYEDHLKWLRIEMNTLLNYERRGEAKGLEKGRAEGRAEGDAERIRKVALKMLAKNKPDDEILEFSGITPGELAELKQTLDI